MARLVHPPPGHRQHPDTPVAGQLAANLFTAGKGANLRLYVEPWSLAVFTGEVYPDAALTTGARPPPNPASHHHAP